MEAQITALRAELAAEEEEVGKRLREAAQRDQELVTDRAALAAARRADGGNLDAKP